MASIQEQAERYMNERDEKDLDRDLDNDTLGDLRNAIMEEFEQEVKSEQESIKFITPSGKSFPKAKIENDIKELMKQYGFNPNGFAEKQIIDTFLRNLYSTKLIKRII